LRFHNLGPPFRGLPNAVVSDNLGWVFAGSNSCGELVSHDDDNDTQQHDGNDDKQLEALEASYVLAQTVFCALEM